MVVQADSVEVWVNYMSITLEGLLGSSYQYIIPVFQRYYSWGRSDWENVWNDITELRESDQDSRRHFMGSLVLGPQQQRDLGKPAVQVIDGQPLSEADLVRNFVFMHISLDKQDGFDDELWIPVERHFEDKDGNLNGGALSGFFRNFLMRNGRYVKPTATFEEFERRYSGAGFDPEDLAIELGWYANYYDIIRGIDKHYSPDVEAALSKLRGLKSTTTYPLLLNLMHRREEGRISDEELVQCVEMISGFILRRYVCGLGSRAYSRWFVVANRELGDQPLEGLRRFFTTGREFPGDEQFRSSLVRYNLYQSDYGRHTLEMLEHSYNHREPPDLTESQIEHIMPQTLTDEWRADLGADN